MSVSSITGYNSSLGHSKPADVEAEQSQAPAKSRTDTADKQGQGQPSASEAVTVSISAEALLALSKSKENTSVVPSYYEQFFPTREGFSAHNLAAAVEDPGAQPFSQNRAFAEVAEAARANLDGKYQQMRDSGQPFDKDSFEGVDWSSLFGELDRRALYAVASNEGGLFSEDEQDIAKSFMGNQQGLAMGAYAGPQSVRGNYSHPGMLDHAQSMKSGIQFRDAVSNEEKASSFEWAEQRAVMQWSYENEMAERGEMPEEIDTEHPLVKLIKAAYETWEHRPGVMGNGNIRNEEDLRAQPWFKGFEGQLDSAIAKTRELYGVS